MFEFVQRCPSNLIMHLWGKLACVPIYQEGEESYGSMFILIAAFSQENPDARLDPKLFSQFSCQASLRRFPLFDLAPGEFPFVCESVGGRSSGNQNFSVLGQNGRCDGNHWLR